MFEFLNVFFLLWFWDVFRGPTCLVCFELRWHTQIKPISTTLKTRTPTNKITVLTLFKQKTLLKYCYKNKAYTIINIKMIFTTNHSWISFCIDLLQVDRLNFYNSIDSCMRHSKISLHRRTAGFGRNLSSRKSHGTSLDPRLLN